MLIGDVIDELLAIQKEYGEVPVKLLYELTTRDVEQVRVVASEEIVVID